MSNFRRTERYTEAMILSRLMYDMMNEDNETCVVILTMTQHKQSGTGHYVVQSLTIIH